VDLRAYSLAVLALMLAASVGWHPLVLVPLEDAPRLDPDRRARRARLLG
jgi:hypothetical protein